MGAWRCLTFSAPRLRLEILAAILHEYGSIGSEERDGRLHAYFAEPVDVAGLVAAVRAGFGRDEGLPVLESSTLVPDGRWHERWMESLEPIEAGKRFLIIPGKAPATPHRSRTGIVLIPQRAFGTGEHATTRMCIELLEESVSPGDGFLDVGTGSGILAIAARALGAAPIMAIDIDPEAVSIAALNAGANRAHEILFAACGLEALAPREADVVAANLYGATLLRLMSEIARRASRHLILSGFTPEEEAGIIDQAARCGMRPEGRLSSEGWVGLLCRRTDGC